MTAAGPPPPPPPPPPSWGPPPAPSVDRHLAADGTVKGPKLWVALSLIGTGIVVGIVSLVVIVTAFVDSLSGPRFDVPGSATVDLESGTWVLYERTSSFGGGFGGFVTIGPEDVSVDGPGPVEVDRSTLNETVTQNEREYTGVLRLEVAEAGSYTITVQGEPSSTGEVLIARPITDVFGRWPFFVLLATGGLLVIGGAVAWIVGGLHRSAVKKAGRLS